MHGMGILNKEVKEAQHGWPEQGHGAGRGGAGMRESRGGLTPEPRVAQMS